MLTTVTWKVSPQSAVKVGPGKVPKLMLARASLFACQCKLTIDEHGALLDLAIGTNVVVNFRENELVLGMVRVCVAA